MIYATSDSPAPANISPAINTSCHSIIIRSRFQSHQPGELPSVLARTPNIAIHGGAHMCLCVVNCVHKYDIGSIIFMRRETPQIVYRMPPYSGTPKDTDIRELLDRIRLRQVQKNLSQFREVRCAKSSNRIPADRRLQ